MSTTVPARGVDELRALLHARELLRAHHALRERRLRDVEGHDVRRLEQLLQGRHHARVAQGQLGHDVVEADVHPQRLRHHRELRADVAVAHDAEGLAPHLARVVRGLGPHPAVQERVLGRDAAEQEDDLGQHELRDRARVGEGRVEDGDAAHHGRVERDLVRADAEGPDGHEPGRGRDHVLRQPRARADADEVRIRDRFLELVPGQGLLVPLDGRVAVALEVLDRAVVHALQEQDLHARLREGRGQGGSFGDGATAPARAAASSSAGMGA
jgi:hypothetical protein